MDFGRWSYLELLVNFAAMFSAPSFDNFSALVKGWVLCVGTRTITRVIQFGGFADDQRRHHSVFYRFFSRASWDADQLGACIFRLVLQLLPDDTPVSLLVDDTLCRKTGAHIWGCGMHHDPLLSNYGRGKTLVKFFSFGHNWVILCVCVPLPWNSERVIAIPIAFCLYRSKKRCPAGQYRKRTELGRELVQMVSAWVPQEREIRLIGDCEYASRTMVHGLPERVVFIGPMHMGAALYAPPEPSQGRGRPRKKGKRLLSPEQLINAKHIRWESRMLTLYGRQVEVLVKSQTALWYRVAGARLIHMIVTRDPKGRIDDRAYFTADAQMGVDDIARAFSMRWSQEEMHHNVKHYLGLEDPQNGWWRRPAGRRRDQRIPGPQPHTRRGALAVTRTVPFVLTTYALVVLWYLANGSFEEDVERVRQRMPWYRHKATPSFGDMLTALRRHLWAEHNISKPGLHQGYAKNEQALSTALQELLAAA